MNGFWKRRGLCALIVAAGALSAPAGALAAGTYEQHFCATGYAGPAANVWTFDHGTGSITGTCDPKANFPHDGLYAVSSAMPEGGWMGIRAQAPPGARYTRIRTDLQIRYQSANRRTYIQDDEGYAWHNHQSRGGSETYNTHSAVLPYDLRDSSFFRIGQACSGSAGGCAAGDFFLRQIVATLHDSTAPSMYVARAGLWDRNRSYYRGVVPVTADIRDDGKGPQRAAIQVDGATAASDAWPDDRCNFRLPQPCPDRLNWAKNVDTAAFPDGARTIALRVDDGLGNEQTVTRSVTFDNTAPVLGPMPVINGRSVTGDDVRFGVSATDATSGLDRIEYAVDGSSWKPVEDGALTVSSAGTHTVQIAAFDTAGNRSAIRIVSFTLLAPPNNQTLTTSAGAPLPGPPGPGDRLACNVGGPWSKETTFTYLWLRDGQVVDGATDQTYTVQPGDPSHRLNCRAAASNEAGQTVVASEPVTAGPRENYGRPTTGTDPFDDFDGDGTENKDDADDDNDGVLDTEDLAPFDPSVGRIKPAPGSDGASGSNGSNGSNGFNGSNGSTGSPGGAGRDGVADPRVGTMPNGTNHSLRAVTSVSGSRSRVLRNGSASTVTGRLLDEDGRAIGNAQLTVSERVFVPNAGHPDGAAWTPVGTVTTRADGSFAYRAPARHSRTVRIAYKAFRDAGEFAATSEVTLLVQGKATLKASRTKLRNGQSVIFSGRVMARPIPTAGVQVELQARTARGWVTFRNTRTKGGGAFKATYRFTNTTGTRSYVFRARTKQDSSYAYMPFTTKQVKVRVSGR